MFSFNFGTGFCSQFLSGNGVRFMHVIDCHYICSQTIFNPDPCSFDAGKVGEPKMKHTGAFELYNVANTMSLCYTYSESCAHFTGFHNRCAKISDVKHVSSLALDGTGNDMFGT